MHTADGICLGLSPQAARQALLECSITRVAFSVALLTLAPLATSAALALLPARLAAGRATRLAVECGVSFAVIWASVPCAMALYPQRRASPTADLEPWLAAATHPVTGEPVREVWYNKGL